MIYIIGTVIIVLGIILLILKRKKRINDESLNYDKEIELPVYSSKKADQIQKTIMINDTNFEINGGLDKYVITKDNRFEFLVVDGGIVACKDRNIHSDFIYYEKVTKNEPN